MIEKRIQYSTVEARKIMVDYIDKSASRLSQRLKKVYSGQKRHATKVRSYA